MSFRSKFRPSSRFAGAFAITLATLSAASLAACGAAPQTKPETRPKGPILHPAQISPSLEGPDAPPIDAFEVGSTDSDETPSSVARRGSEAVAVFTRDGHLYARRLDLGKGPAADAIDLGAHAPLGGAGMRVVATSTGYVVFWDEAVDQNQILKLLALDANGKPAGAPLVLPPISEKLRYASVLAFDGAVLLVHDLEHDGASDVYVTAIDAGVTKTAGPAQLVSHGALGWDVAAGAHEAYFAIVAPPSGQLNEGEPLGPVRAFTVDVHGKKGAEIRIADRDVSDIDVQVAALDGCAAVAFTDHSDMEGAVNVAIIKATGIAVPAKRVSPPLGEAAFVEIVGPRTGKAALVSWENVGEASDALRVIHYATVTTTGQVSNERGAFVIDPRAQAEMAADGDGFALLTLAPASVIPKAGDPAAPPPKEDSPWPSFVRLGPDLSVRGAEPVRFAGTRSKDGVPDVTYGLTCDAGACGTLAAASGKPSSLFLAVLPTRESRWKPVAWREDASKKPAIHEARSIMTGDALARVATHELGGGAATTLTAWTTYFVDGARDPEPAPKGEPPYAATLAVRAAHADGTLGEPVVVSKRATSEGGVAIAEAPGKGKSEAILAWVANEKGSAQVYVTRVDADAKKIAQKKLTVLERKKTNDAVSSASSASIVFAPPTAEAKKKGSKEAEGTFVVGWVDTRDKNGEVYLARINRDLDKVVIDKRITTAPGDAADVDMLIRGTDTYVVYSDVRDGSTGDIYIARVDTETLRVKEEGRVYSSSAHSHGPKLALAGDHVVVTWIEDASDAVGATSGATLRVAELDAGGRLVSAPFVVEAPKSDANAPTGIASFAITCSGATLTSCRMTFAAALDQGQALYGLTLGADCAPGAPVRLASLATAPLTDASLSFADPNATSVSLLEQGSVGRVRSLKIDW